MSLMWSPFWKKMFATRSLPIIIRNNYRLLELVGEPVYLLVRGRVQDQNKKIQKVFNNNDFIEEQDFVYLVLWKKGDDIGLYPDLRDFILRKNNNEMNNVYVKDFIKDLDSFAIEVIRNNLELQIEHEVRIYFKKELKNNPVELIAEFYHIEPEFDDAYRQTSDFVSSKGMQYGWRQALWRGCYFKDNFIRGAFLMAFPDLRRDLLLEKLGFVVDSVYDAWTSPPPLSPLIYEHDVIVRLSGLRYEVRDMIRNTIENILVQQEFRISEIDPSNPIYEIPVDTVVGRLEKFPKKIYTGR